MNNQSKINISSSNELVNNIATSAENVNSILEAYQGLVGEANSLLAGQLTAQLNKCREAVSQTQKNLNTVFDQYGQTLKKVIESRQATDTTAGSDISKAVSSAVEAPKFN